MSTRSIPSATHIRLALLLLASSAPFLGVPTALAATDAEIGAKVRECASIRRNKDRLRCFDDALAIEAPASVAAAPAEPPATEPAVAAPAAASEEFGREQVERPEPKPKPSPESQRLEAVVAAIDKRRDGLLTVTLDNEQVWRQKSVTPLFRLRVGDKVTLKKGRFGGYTLVAPGRKSTAVSRIE